MFAVVEFANSKKTTNEIAVVPLTWIYKNERKCYWPTKLGNKKFDDFVKSQGSFKKSWPSYKIFKIHFKTDDYDAAEDKLNQIIYQTEDSGASTASSTKSLVRKHHQEPETTSSSSDSELETYTTPKRAHMTLPGPSQVSPSPNISTLIREDCTPTSNKSTSSFTEFVSDFQSTVLQSLTRLTENVDQHSIMLNEIVRSLRTSNETSVTPPADEDMPKFPIGTLQEFQGFDNKIIENKQIRQYMVSRLAAVGGSGLESLTRRILKYLITNEVGCLFNWKGRDKLSFEKTAIMDVIYEAAKKNFPPNERNDLIIANSVKEWLKYSKARQSYKKSV